MSSCGAAEAEEERNLIDEVCMLGVELWYCIYACACVNLEQFYQFVQSILLDTANSATSHLLPKIIEPQYIIRLTRTPKFFFVKW